MISPHLRRLADAIDHVQTRSPNVVRTLQFALVGRANGSQGVTRGGRYARAALHREQRSGAAAVMGPILRTCWDRWGWGGAVVRIVRRAPKALDDDNLAAAAKSVRDGVADALRVSDRDPRVTWLVDQETAAESTVRVEVYRWDAPQWAPVPRPATKSRRGGSRAVPTPNVVRRGKETPPRAEHASGQPEQ